MLGACGWVDNVIIARQYLLSDFDSILVFDDGFGRLAQELDFGGAQRLADDVRYARTAHYARQRHKYLFVDFVLSL